MESNISQTIITYSEILPYFFLSFIIALLATPLVGKLARKLGAIDLPARLRSDSEDSSTSINKNVTVRLGGLAIVLAIGLVLLISESVGFSDLSVVAGFNSWGIWLGVLVLTIVGIWDDIKDLHPGIQFVAQFIAATLVVASGVKVDQVSIGNELIQSLGSFQVQFLLQEAWTLPADLIIILWIVAIINFVNWASGIDALHGGLSAVAGGTMLLIALQNGNPVLATLIAIHVGAILGVLPFNYHPSKIFYGFGESINGFLLAVFALSGDIKFATSLVILGLPVVDALWVILNRMWRSYQQRESWKQILTAPLHGDKTHLHHRLMELGYSWKTIFLIEVVIMTVFALAAFTFSGFNISSLTLQLILVFLAIVLIFLVINIARKRAKDTRLRKKILGQKDATVEVKIAEPEDDLEKDREEEKYIY